MRAGLARCLNGRISPTSMSGLPYPRGRHDVEGLLWPDADLRNKILKQC